MKKWLGLAMALGLLISGPVQARIGDNVQQLRQVYGATGKVVGNSIIFQRNGYSICVYFDGDHSGMEVFTRDGSEKGKSTISFDDIKSILKMEGEGQGWSEMVGKSGGTVWLRADRKLIARLSDAQDADNSTSSDVGLTPSSGKVLVVMLNQK